MFGIILALEKRKELGYTVNDNQHPSLANVVLRKALNKLRNSLWTKDSGVEIYCTYIITRQTL